jgi:hypothetical protein
MGEDRTEKSAAARQSCHAWFDTVPTFLPAHPGQYGLFGQENRPGY